MSSIPPHVLVSSPEAQSLYAAVDGRMAGLGAEEAVFFEKQTGRSHVMTRDVAQAFGQCQAFLPMADHVAAIVHALPALKGQEAAVRKVLEMFVARGLMQTDTQFVAGFQGGAAVTQAPVSGVFVIASGALDALGDRLAALGEHALLFGLPGPVFVVDPASDVAPQAALARFNAGAIGWIGRRQAERMSAELAADLGVDASIFQALLSVPGPGAARNLIALLAAGTRCVVLDAGVALPLLRHPDFSPGLLADPRAFAIRSFGSAAAALAAGVPLDADPLAAHLDVCGLPLAGAMLCQPSARLGREGLHGIVAARVPWLAPDTRVAVTMVGRRGRFALSDPTFPFRLDAASRAGLTETREAYLANYREPAMWLGTARFALGVGDSLSPLAMDASRLVPCTLPMAPRATQLQIALWRLSDATAADLAFPDALRQIVPGTAADDPLGRPDTAQCMAGLVAHVAQDLYATAPQERLAVVAAKLADLAGADDTRLNHYLAEYLAYHRSSAIDGMQQVLASADKPPVYWVADLRAAVETQGKALVSGEVPRLAGWPAGLDAAGCAARLREELRCLSDGLAVWPAAFARAIARSAEWRVAVLA